MASSPIKGARVRECRSFGWGVVTSFDIDGPLLIEPKTYHDTRGYFRESFNWWALMESGYSQFEQPFVQDNESRSHFYVLRGLHFQRGQDAQAKLVRVPHGGIFDVAADLRPGSPTFGRWLGVRLTHENGAMLYVPRGFAHGFLTEDWGDTVVAYKCDGYYRASACGGVRWDDPDLGIEWPAVGLSRAMLDAKDRNWPLLKELGADPTEFAKMSG